MQSEAFPSASTVTIRSDDLVSVYAYQFFASNGTASFLDAALIEPITRLGLRYFIVTPPTQVSQPSGQQGVNFFHITASQDDTNVTIVGLNATVQCGHLSNPGANTTTTLQRLGMTSCSTNETDLTGVVIEADKPVAVSSGIVRGSLEGCMDTNLDHVWALLPPVEKWAKEFFIFPTPGKSEDDPLDIYHIVTSKAKTYVTINDGEHVIRLNTSFSWVAVNTNQSSGVVEWDKAPLDTNRFYHIQADNPFLVVKTARQLPCDACMLTLTAANRFAQILTFALPDTSEWKGQQNYAFYLTIITLSHQADDITLNGVKLSESNATVNWTRINDYSPVVGGHLTLPMTSDVYTLSSVTGDSILFAYLTGGKKYRKLCFAVGDGVASVDDETTTSQSYTSQSQANQVTTTNSVTDTSISSTPSSSVAQAQESTSQDSPLQESTSQDTPLQESTSQDSPLQESTSQDSPLQESTSQDSPPQESTSQVNPLQESTSQVNPLQESTSQVNPLQESTSSQVSPLQESSTETSFFTQSTTGEVTAQSHSTSVSVTTATSTSTVWMSTLSTTPGPSNTAVKPAELIRKCQCVRKEMSPAEKQEAKEAADAAIEEIKSDLTVDTGNLSATVRKVTSAPDARTSSAVMGSTAIVMTCLMFCVPMLFDVITLVMWLCRVKGNNRRVSSSSQDHHQQGQQKQEQQQEQQQQDQQQSGAAT
ncbi:hypothetical protein V1264_003580 [Littorina saxatilis]|uniref:IgGFc-binding protein N-terminal domain-containing protein n=1 Tax=Littorina saxatilis TaxID=31220 RepID=A0AAN9GA45_9CAEN